MPDDKASEFEFKKLPPPTQCALWEQPDLVTAPRGRFETVETYEDDSHLRRALLKCRECGQLYFYEFYEQVDWDNGDDAQYSTYIPVPERDEALRIKDLPVYGLMRYSPRLQWDHPTGKPARLNWIGKP
jgi:hypothetical protein